MFPWQGGRHAATFHLERLYPAPAARVWTALTDARAKARWFTDDAGKREHGTGLLLDALGASLKA